MSQILPKDGSRLNYRIIGFSVPSKEQVTAYKIEIAIGNIISDEEFQKNIIVFCRSGGRSSQAKTILQQNGFTNVINGGTWETVRRFVA